MTAQHAEKEKPMLTVWRCQQCGARSMPFFGFPYPCRSNRRGRHQEQYVEEVEEEEAQVSFRLKLAYEYASSRDRQGLRDSTSETAQLARRLLGIA